MRQIPDFEQYGITENGEVINVKTERILKTSFHKGYYQVNLNKNGKQYTRRIHQLVALTFIGERPDGYDIDHIDGNSKNNNFKNLEYCKHSENMRRAYEKNLVGLNRNKIKVIQKNKNEIINEFTSIRKASIKTSTAYTNIRNCINGLCKSAGGYEWERACD
jgi:hypothetical protein